MTQKENTVKKYIEGGTRGAIESLIQGFLPTAIIYGFLQGGAQTFDETKKERINEFVVFLQENEDFLDESFFKNPVFVNHFYKTFECYLRHVDIKKLELIKAVFSGYLFKKESDDKLDIERFYSVINSISLNTIIYLNMLCEIIPPYFEAEKSLFEEEKYRGKPMGWAEYCKDGWTYLTKYTQQYIHEEFDPNSKKVKERYQYDSKTDTENKLLDEIYTIKRIEERKHDEAIAELISLGILIPRVEGGGGIGGGGGNFEANLTNFGFQFLKFLNV